MGSADRRSAPQRADGPGARLSSGGCSSRVSFTAFHSAKFAAEPAEQCMVERARESSPLCPTLPLKAPRHHLAIITRCAVSLLHPQTISFFYGDIMTAGWEMFIITVGLMQKFLSIITTETDYSCFHAEQTLVLSG